jgi:hypothetical protein
MRFAVMRCAVCAVLRSCGSESEDYLPHACPLEHLIDEQLWEETSCSPPHTVPTLHSPLPMGLHHHGTPTTMGPHGTPTTKGPPMGLTTADRHEAPPPQAAVRIEARAGERAGVLAERVHAALSAARAPPHLIEVWWTVDTSSAAAAPSVEHAPPPATRIPLPAGARPHADNSALRGGIADAASRAEAAVEAVLARGPHGGWCVQCAQPGAVPAPLLRVGSVLRRHSGNACTFCLNMTRLLRLGWLPE